MKIIHNKTYDGKRALYNLKDAKVINCIFAGNQDGEIDLMKILNQEFLKLMKLVK